MQIVPVSMSGVQQKRLFDQISVVNLPAASAPSAKRRKKQPAPEENAADAGGFLAFQRGDVIYGHYELVEQIGEGNFGKVVSVVDRRTRWARPLAVKIMRNQEHFRLAGRREAHIMARISRHDPTHTAGCLGLLEHFDWHGHYCLVFPRLGQSVYDFMKHNGHRPFPLPQVRSMARQLLEGLRFLHKLGYTHTDLKPENVLFVHPGGSRCTGAPVKNSERLWFEAAKGSMVEERTDVELRIIDFGTTVREGENKCPKVQTQHYRAPEVLLELGWDATCDVFSVGCIIYELYSGATLFQTQDDREHLAMMQRTLGDIPRPMIRSTKTEHFDRRSYRLRFDEDGAEAEFVRTYYKPLYEHIRPEDAREPGVNLLFGLIKGLLAYDPKTRLPLDGALAHAFFTAEPEPLPPPPRSPRKHALRMPI